MSVSARVDGTHDSNVSAEAYSSRPDDQTLCAIVQSGQRVRRASQLTLEGDTLSPNNTTIERNIPQSDPGRLLEKCLRKDQMTMKDRKVLQVLLAQSVLFFPWMGRDLNKASIAFHSNLNRPFATLIPDLNDHCLEVMDEGQPEEADYKPYNNETLAALAITLLEIELGRPIEDLTIEEDLGDGDVSAFDSKFWATTRVLKTKQDDIYRGCYAAIDACLRCDFVDEMMTLDNPDFAQQVYERVVAPLEQELSHGFSIKMPFSGIPDTTEESTVDSSGWGTSDATVRVATPAPRKSVRIYEDVPLGDPRPEAARDTSPRASAATATPTSMVTAAPAASAVP